MNKLKRTLALLATLAMATTAFVGCGGDDASSTDATDAPTDAATDAATDDGGDATDEATDDQGGEEASALGEIKLGTDGDTFTIMTWTDADLAVMQKSWEADTGLKMTLKNFGCQGGEAADNFDQYFLGGEDVDLFCVEADWCMKYINDDTKTAPLSDLGFSESNFSDCYSYTVEIGRALTAY